MVRAAGRGNAEGMNKRLPDLTVRRHLLPTVALTLLTLGAWAGWLGWDQQRDVHADGSQTGPYEAWQVIGLVLTLLGPVVWAALRSHPAVGVVGVSAGLAVASFADWSDDATGLFMVGVLMITFGSLAATTALSAVLVSFTKPRGPQRPLPQWGQQWGQGHG